jgi:hypothetical protein
MKKTAVFIFICINLSLVFTVKGQNTGSEQVCYTADEIPFAWEGSCDYVCEDEFTGEPYGSSLPCGDGGEACACSYGCGQLSCDLPECPNPQCPGKVCDCYWCGDFSICGTHECPLLNGNGGGDNGTGGGGSSGGGSGSSGGSNNPTRDCNGVINGAAYKDNCGFCVGGTTGKQPCSVSLFVANPTITLMDDYDLNLNYSSVTFANMSEITFKIGKNGTWWTLQTGRSTSCHELARKPGYYKLKVAVKFSNGTTFNTSEKDIEVQFPDIAAIQNNAAVSAAMSTVWQETKNAASSSGRSERCFWIYANTEGSNLTFEPGATVSGANISGCIGTSASVSPGSSSGNERAGTPLIGGKYWVAMFHTHTPLTYCPSNAQRQTGPSLSDISYSNTGTGIPCLLYDYTGGYVYGVNGDAITGGHNLNASAQIYTFGSSRRINIP